LDAKLYLCSTPIGNMEDISLRCLRILKEVDCIYCEDTRHSLGLLKHYGITKPLISCHEHNERQRSREVCDKLQSGLALAYISDAGMPGISDPGARLIEACIERELPFEVIPGASASLTALVLSGLPVEDACFVGFLPRSGAERRERIGRLAKHHGTLILYESPLRVGDTCEELKNALGDRPAALVRELTKLHECCVRDSLGGLSERYADAPPKGECVLLVGGLKEGSAGADPIAMLRELLSSGMRAKDAAKQVSALTDMSRNEAYSLALSMLEE